MTGIICLNKPKDITSFTAAAIVRRIASEKKCGHTGTLDPMATGVLPILLGGMTRFSDFLPSHDKAYRATLRLGLTTDTLDITGKELTRRPVTASAAQVKTALRRFVGEIEQLPPMYSAIRVDGVRLYELARRGEEVERQTRRVTVFSAELTAADEQNAEYTIEVACSAGTYIRTLAADLGELLGCGATLTALTRTAANGFTLAQTATKEELEAARNAGDLARCLISPEAALAAYPAVSVTPAQATRFANGGALDLARLQDLQGEGLFRVYDPQQTLLGLGETANGELAVRRVLQMK